MGTGGKTAWTLEGSEESPDWGGRRPWIVAVPGPVGPGRRIDLRVDGGQTRSADAEESENQGRGDRSPDAPRAGGSVRATDPEGGQGRAERVSMNHGIGR